MVEAKNREISQLQSDLNALRSNVDSANAAKGDSEASLRNAQDANARLTQEKIALENEITGLKNQIAQLIVEKENERAKLNDALGQVARAEAGRAQAEVAQAQAIQQPQAPVVQQA